MDKVQKPSINECYTPSSEPYRVYMLECIENYTNTELTLQVLRLKLNMYDEMYEYYSCIKGILKVLKY
jgi:hypothetical protein